ncbi:hypothetical protein HPP92_003167 [Vanilla planifolia]|uniref:RING-type domain-containing protein n=1 Tax=Vanilla planifolia TaxID=51239 RepID=A0A835VN13_VANPL|nr:hypothetical protein HPP92_003559 [Vanilla planifolia]KAG0503095.1 hypothetical protein HPP92_003167 [Vanilla planifolia]
MTWYSLPSAWSPQPRNRPRKKRPVTVLVDDSMVTNAGQSGISVDKPLTIFCRSQCLHNASPLGMIAVDCDLNADGIHTAKPSTPPMESTLSCPVCLCPLNEPSSTTCGHVFCNSCIATAIEKQKKCPTCRKKLNKRNFHRIYLPSH